MKNGFCHFGNVVGGMPCNVDYRYWELADGIEADVPLDAETVPVVTEQAETESKKLRSICNNCLWWNETCYNKKSCCYGDYKDYNGFCGWFERGEQKGMKEHNHDSVNSPSHYTSGGIECIDCIKAALGENFIGFLIGNVIKYTYRYKHKNGVEDLEKARWYLDRAIKELEHNDTE